MYKFHSGIIGEKIAASVFARATDKYVRSCVCESKRKSRERVFINDECN